MFDLDLDAPRVVNTASLIALALDGRDRGYNRQLDAQEISSHADLNGLHLLTMALPYHNGMDAKQGPHHRCSVMIREPGTPEPTIAMIDVSADNWDRLTKAADLTEAS